MRSAFLHLYTTFIVIVMIAAFPYSAFSQSEIDLSGEFSADEFRKGIRAFNSGRYESSYIYFTKAISFDSDNDKARYWLGESYRKAGYERNALFEWNALLQKGFQSRELKNKISLLYNSRGKLDEIFLSKGYLLRDDIRGYYNDKTPPLFLKPSQIAVDKNNNYYICSFLDSKIVVLDANMHHLRSILPLTGGFEQPFGVAVNSKGTLFVSDYKNDVIIELDENGFAQRRIGFKGLGAGGLIGPKSLAIDDEDNIYVSDFGNKRINKYKESGETLFSFGSEIAQIGGLKSPTGLFYENGLIYVCDRDANRVVVFDTNGNYVSTVGEGNLRKPTDIIRDSFGRLLVLCEKQLWAYEPESSLWYVIDALGNRLDMGVSLAVDGDRNIIVSDFNKSEVYVLSLEYSRYTNLHVNVERVFTENYPTVHLAVKVVNNDLSVPVGLDNTNFSVYENGVHVPMVGSVNTQRRDEIDDIVIIFDCKAAMRKYAADFRVILDRWLQNKAETTNVSFMTVNEDDVVTVCDFGTGRLTILDALDNINYSDWTDIGFAIKNAAYYMMSRFSRKAIILVTDGDETKNNFNKFKTDDAEALLANNDITLNVVSFRNGNVSDLMKFMTANTDGIYCDAYKKADLQDLMNKIEQQKGSEVILTYRSKAVSRFGEEPINLFLEVSYNGTKGTTSSVYFPPRM